MKWNFGTINCCNQNSFIELICNSSLITKLIEFNSKFIQTFCTFNCNSFLTSWLLFNFVDSEKRKSRPMVVITFASMLYRSWIEICGANSFLFTLFWKGMIECRNEIYTWILSCLVSVVNGMIDKYKLSWIRVNVWKRAGGSSISVAYYSTLGAHVHFATEKMTRRGNFLHHFYQHFIWVNQF
jgi:hypothetical protein